MLLLLLSSGAFDQSFLAGRRGRLFPILFALVVDGMTHFFVDGELLAGVFLDHVWRAATAHDSRAGEDVR